jgi:hypothetical protein
MKIYDKIKEQIQADFFKQNFSNDGQRFVAWYLRNMMCQHFSGHKVKQHFAATRSQRAICIH